jgi:hypothetical protein
MARPAGESALAAVAHHVQDAVRCGARLLTGGTPLAAGPTAYAPTVLDGCTDDMLVMADETFGPVAAVAVVGSWEEALERAGGGPVKHMRPSDYRAAVAALNAGRPIGLDSDGRLGAALQALAKDLAGVVKLKQHGGREPGGMLARLAWRRA